MATILSSVPREMTRDNDVEIKINMSETETVECFYVGKGSYVGDIKIYWIPEDGRKIPFFFQIGRYCSLAGDIKIFFDLNHDYHSVYQGTIAEFEEKESRDYRKSVGQNLKYIDRKRMILIGNDCWIGSDVIILSGVTIGDGAVIAAGSVVVKDVPPYTIYGGNPASFIRYRFSSEIMFGMNQIAWWRFSSKELIDAKMHMQGKPRYFVKRYLPKAQIYQKRSGKNLPSLVNGKVPLFLLFINCMDLEWNSVVINSFLDSLKKKAELILCYHSENQKEKLIIESVFEILDSKWEECFINIFEITENEEEKIISEVDYLILTKELVSIERFALAGKYGVKCISGFDYPVISNQIKAVVENPIRLFVLGSNNFSYPLLSGYMPLYEENIFADQEQENCFDSFGTDVFEKKRNPVFCELMGIYWIWKCWLPNHSDQYVGVMSQNKYFRISERGQYLDDAHIRKLLEKRQMIIPVDKAEGKRVNLNREDGSFLEIIDKIIRKKYPKYYSSLIKCEQKMTGEYPAFITKRYLFEGYCDWLFNIIFEMKQQNDFMDDILIKEDEMRIAGTVLLNIWIDSNSISCTELLYE